MKTSFTEQEARTCIGRRVRSKGGGHNPPLGVLGTTIEVQETSPGEWTVVVDWDMPCKITRTWFQAQDYKSSVSELDQRP